MLTELRIQNFAIIEELSLELSPGLNVISGETGSGKSLVLDAFQLILGARPKTSYIRKGTEGWEIEALISLEDISERIRESLPEQVRKCREVLINRSMNANGRGKVYLNGKLGTVQMLQEISSRILALCTQGQQMQLTDSAYLLELLDEYVGAESLVEKYRGKFSDWQKLDRELQAVIAAKEQRLLKQAEREFLIHELGDLSPTSGLRVELEDSLNELKSKRKTGEAVQSALDLLLAQTGVFALLDRCRKVLSGVPDAPELKSEEQLISAEESLSDLEKQLRSFDWDSVWIDADYEKVSERLSELARLERKYRTDDAGLALLYENARAALDDAGELERETLLREAVVERKGQTLELAKELRERRREGASSFEEKVGKELSDLGMKSASLSFQFEEHEPRASGTELVEFMFCPNVGEGLRPLHEIASGGELSRVMLVTKKLFQDKNGVSILVFDEVDSGVSGAVAQAMGEKMSNISGFSQVVCITHLPQVACYADRHFSISKESGNRTRSIARQLAHGEQVEELARMLSGYQVTEAARASAAELLSSKTSRTG